MSSDDALFFGQYSPVSKTFEHDGDQGSMGSGMVGDLGTRRTRRIEKVNCFSRSEDSRIVVVIQRVSI